jgi:hypothetical protein
LKGEIEGLQKWRVGGGIWRGLKNRGLFGGHAGVVFVHQISKIWSRGPYGCPTGVALTGIYSNLITIYDLLSSFMLDSIGPYSSYVPRC